jgi:hypothetical protein
LVFLRAKNTGCVLNVSKTLERAHCRSQVLGVDDVVPLEHRARAMPAHPHDDGFRDADSARPGDEAPPEIVEPEAVELGSLHGAEEPLLHVHPAHLGLRIPEDVAGGLRSVERRDCGFGPCGEEDEPRLVRLRVLGRERDSELRRRRVAVQPSSQSVPTPVPTGP